MGIIKYNDLINNEANSMSNKRIIMTGTYLYGHAPLSM